MRRALKQSPFPGRVCPRGAVVGTGDVLPRRYTENKFKAWSGKKLSVTVSGCALRAQREIVAHSAKFFADVKKATARPPLAPEP